MTAMLPGMEPPPVYDHRDAVLSDDGTYRYRLTRRWDPEAPDATFVMLNPSTADAQVDDATIRRCIGFARSWECGGLQVVNLYALRSTDPTGLWSHPDPVGPDNDQWLTETIATAAGPLIAAWGTHGRPDRVQAVLTLEGFARVEALGLTKAGAPRHPLYLPATAPRSPYQAKDS